MQWRWARRRQTFADWLIAVAVPAVGLVSALTAASPIPVGGATSIVGPRAVVAASYALAGAALLFRRQAPFAMLLAVTAVLALPFLAFGASEGFGSVVPVFIALYSVGAHSKMAWAIGALALYTGFWVLLELRDPLNPNLHSALGSWPVYLVGVTVLLVGAYMRTRRLYVAELRARADAAESDREERIRAATADERARIARELHDAVAHAMSVMVMQAEAADEILEIDQTRARLAIERVQLVGREGLGEMRRLLGVLRQDESPALAPQPGIASLPALVDQVSAVGLPVRLTVDGEPRPLSAGVDISAYRIIQEALTNVLKHAGACAVAVRLCYTDQLTLEVVDDGVGVGRNGAGTGHGLIGMRERVMLYGGTLQAGARADGGFRVHATLPIEQAS